jgi:hypothetical protein
MIQPVDTNGEGVAKAYGIHDMMLDLISLPREKNSGNI